tara:strand:+ start:2018 stop:3211 length:1194 start_codon:yes stop_codon:yes gene_type:complete
MHLSIVTEGPLAFDGKGYLFSEGGGYYIDSVAKHFGKVTILAYAVRLDNPLYSAISHYEFTGRNISISEYPLSKSGSILGKLKQLVNSSLSIYRQIRKSDVFYIFLPGYPGAMAALLCRITGRPYFVYLASDWPEEAATLNPIRNLVGKMLLPLYRFSVSWLQNRAVGGARFTLVHGQQLIDKYSDFEKSVRETVPRLYWPKYKLFDRQDTCQGEFITLLFVGYLIERKGAKHFIEAVGILRKKGLKVRGLIIGTGDEELSLKKLVAELGLDEAISFTGYLPNGEPLIERYRSADIFVCSSFSGEGFPRVLYEAMSQGLPIVSSDVCGIPLKLKPDENAVFAPPKNPDAIANQAIRLIEDDSLRQHLIRNGYLFMSNLIEDADGGKQVSELYEQYKN